MKKVSVIIPAYNKAEYTCRTVESVLGQTYLDREIIVVDDGSKDQTRLKMEGFGQKIRYFYKENGGACSARNEGIRHANGEYLAFIDCDDLYELRKLEICIDYLERHSEFGFIHTGATFIDREGHAVGHYNHPRSQKQGWIIHRLILGNFICNSTVIARKELVEKAGLFDESIFTPGDWDMWLRMARVARAGYISLPLTSYRVEDNYIFNRLEQAYREEKYVLDKFFIQNSALRCLKRKACACYHLRFAQCHMLKGQEDQFKREFYLSLKNNPLYWKAWLMLIGFKFFPQHLKIFLKKKIIR